MNPGGGVHTVPAPGDRTGWWNVMDGKTLSKHRLKEVAVESGRVVARRFKVEHTIHKEDGTIGEKNSYGHDPHPPKG